MVPHAAYFDYIFTVQLDLWRCYNGYYHANWIVHVLHYSLTDNCFFLLKKNVNMLKQGLMVSLLVLEGFWDFLWAGLIEKPGCRAAKPVGQGLVRSVLVSHMRPDEGSSNGKLYNNNVKEMSYNYRHNSIQPSENKLPGDIFFLLLNYANAVYDWSVLSR